MATHSSILAWGIPWTGEPGGLQFMGTQRVRYDRVTEYTSLGKADNIHTFAGKFQGVL